ncbi:MAG: biotin/lipoyl-containing protein, partial [Vicinamibacterales bacterium]
MPIDVVMPQMGESITEGTIVRWIKQVGDAVDRDEPLFEISTDKVDAEIPSPVAGVLTEIHVREGETVAVNSVVAVIGQVGEAAVGSRLSPVASQQSLVGGQDAQSTISNPQSAIHDRPHLSSPVVRKIAQEHHVDFSQIHGTGAGGRVTKRDILHYVSSRQSAVDSRQSPVGSPQPPAPGPRSHGSD